MDFDLEDDDDVTRIYQPEGLGVWQVRLPEGETDVLSSVEIEARLRTGALPSSAHVAEQGTSNWRLLSEIPAFARALLGETEAAELAGPRSPPPSSPRNISMPLPAAGGDTLRGIPLATRAPATPPRFVPQEVPSRFPSPEDADRQPRLNPFLGASAGAAPSPSTPRAVAAVMSGAMPSAHSPASPPPLPPAAQVLGTRRPARLGELGSDDVLGSDAVQLFAPQHTATGIGVGAPLLSPASISSIDQHAPMEDSFARRGPSRGRLLTYGAGVLGAALVALIGVEVFSLREDLEEVNDRTLATQQAALEARKTAEQSREAMPAKSTDGTDAMDKVMEKKDDEDAKSAMAKEEMAKPEHADKEMMDDSAAEPRASPKGRAVRSTTAALRPKASRKATSLEARAEPPPSKPQRAEPVSRPEPEPAPEPAKEVAVDVEEQNEAESASAAVVAGPAFDVDAVKATLKRAAKAASTCGESSTSGKVPDEARVRVLFSHTGAVQRVNIQTEDLDEEIGKCIVERFQNVRVPAYGGKQRAVSKNVSLR